MHALSGDATDTQVLGDDISSLETLPVSGLEMGFNSWWFFRVALLILKHRIYGPTVNNVVFSTFISSYDVWRSFQGLYAIHTYVRGIGFLLHPHCLMFTPIWGYSFRCNNLRLCLDTWKHSKITPCKFRYFRASSVNSMWSLISFRPLQATAEELAAAAAKRPLPPSTLTTPVKGQAVVKKTRRASEASLFRVLGSHVQCMCWTSHPKTPK